MSQRQSKEPDPASGAAQNRVKELRLELGLTRVALAKLADLSDKTLDRLERGSQELRETTCRKIFNALNRARAKESLSALEYSELFNSEAVTQERD